VCLIYLVGAAPDRGDLTWGLSGLKFNEEVSISTKVPATARKWEKYLRISLVLTLIFWGSTQVFPQIKNFESREQPAKNDFLTFSINVGLVVLPITVLNKSGRCISGLEEKDFRIYEDGVPQKIQVFDHKDIPVAVGLVIDNSSSMVPKRPEVISAALDLAESSNPEDQIFVIHFYEKVAFGLKLEEAFTNNIEELRAGRIPHCRNRPHGFV